MVRQGKVIHGDLMDETISYTLEDICHVSGTSAEVVIEMVEYGIIEPRGSRPQEWQFSHPSLQRYQRALRLKHDLGINLAGLALALDLLSERENLLNKIHQLEIHLRSFYR